MSTFFFSIPGQLSIKICSNQDLSFSDSEYLLLRAYVPGIVRSDAISGSADIEIEHIESHDKKLLQQDNKIKIYDTWKKSVPGDIYHLLYGMARVQLLKHQLFSVHGACVGEDEQILIVGHSGSGKTSVILKLLQNSDIKIFSGNKTVVSFNENHKFVAVSGTPTITIRGSDKNILEDLNISEYVEYWGRYAFLLQPERYTITNAAPIKAIVMVRLNDYTQERQEVNSHSALHSLYPFFLDVVNADIVMSDLEEVFVGAPPKGTEKYLVTQLKSALKDIPVYSLIGSASFVAAEIKKI